MITNSSLNEYTFGELLKKLLSISHQKSYVLAAYLNYDVSYISKWVTGNMLPAYKHAGSMCSGIAKFIVESAKGSPLEDLYDIFGVDSKERLEYEINEALIRAYQVSGEQTGKSKSILISNENNSRTVVNPNLQKLYIKVNPAQLEEKPEHMGLAMMMDFCALGKEDKMSIAHADRADNFFDYVTEIHYLLSLSDDTIDIKFDTLLLTYMLNNYADLNFILSYYKHVPCSLMFAVQNYCMHMSCVAENHRAILSDTSMDQGVANETYDTIIAIEHSFTKRLVTSKSINSIMENNDYLSFVISQNISLYITVMDEFFLPDDVFEELLEANIKKPAKRKLKNASQYFLASVKLSNLRLALLERTLQNYVINGELDFYGHPVVLSIDQRERHLNHLSQITNNDNISVVFIDPHTLVDFERDFMPCIYISDCMGYVRLRSSIDSDKICLIESLKLKELYGAFMDIVFEELASSSSDSMAKISRMLKMLKNIQ